MKTILMFPGQGSQKVGMGAALFPQFPEETALASRLLGYDAAKVCLEETERAAGRDLNNTTYTQPLLYLVNHLSFLAQPELAAKATGFIGHSLGEYNALTAAGVFNFETGLRLTQKRAALMAQVGKGGMAAVLGLTASKLQAALQQVSGPLEIANYNSPEQLIVSGEKAALAQLEAVVKAAGAKRFVPLTVSGAFHSSFMRPPAEAFGAFLKTLANRFSAEKAPAVYANVTGAPYPTTATEVVALLEQQLYSPVEWVKTIEALKQQFAAEGVEFTEVGPGKVLTGLVRRIRL